MTKSEKEMKNVNGPERILFSKCDAIIALQEAFVKGWVPVRGRLVIANCPDCSSSLSWSFYDDNNLDRFLPGGQSSTDRLFLCAILARFLRD